ncbi:MAG: hypothetical protein AOA65_0646 [Candidatus Bathyarchaeota archaeon BA1]|nr:MAG: hypothetical protein AOA65_0646 [Candidatus Bathyarchaeota archaeon BA1]
MSERVTTTGGTPLLGASISAVLFDGKYPGFATSDSENFKLTSGLCKGIYTVFVLFKTTYGLQPNIVVATRQDNF